MASATKTIPVRPLTLSAREADQQGEHDHAEAVSRREIGRVLFVAAAAGAMWFAPRPPSPYITAIGVICAIVGGFPIFHEAYENIVERRMTMELSMTIAIVAALAIRELFPCSQHLFMSPPK